MKILVCNTHESKGGAAKSARRIYECLKSNGQDVHYITYFSETSDEDVYSPNSFVDKILRFVIPKLDYLLRIIFIKDRKVPFSASLFSSGVPRFLNSFSPDIVNLNYTNMGFLSIKDLTKIKAPIVWTLHDSWAFSGGIHLPSHSENLYPELLNKHLLRYPKSFNISEFIFLQKKKLWRNLDITIVSPSRWLATRASQSSVFKKEHIKVIPNPINTTIFKPRDKIFSRRKLELDLGNRYILFGAVNGLKDSNKGFKMLLKAIKMLGNEDIKILSFGSQESSFSDDKIIELGYIEDQEELSYIYSAADVTVLPSFSENFPNVLLESVSCGTPIVGFAVGGIPEIIKDDSIGSLAKPYEIKDLSLKIKETLYNKKFDRGTMHRGIEKEYGFEEISNKYINLYKSILE